MTIPEIVKIHGGPARFARLSGIPFRTVQSWCRAAMGAKDGRKPPAWVARLLVAVYGSGHRSGTIGKWQCVAGREDYRAGM